MEINEIMTLISSQGFPIVMCIVLIFYIKDRDDKMQEAFDRMTDAFTEFKALIESKKGGD